MLFSLFTVRMFFFIFFIFFIVYTFLNVACLDFKGNCTLDSLYA